MKVLSSIVWNIPVFGDKSSQQSFHGNTLTTKKIKMEESEGVRFDLFHLFSFYLSCFVKFNTSFAYREERQEFEFTASNEAIEYLANISKCLKYNYNFNK